MKKYMYIYLTVVLCMVVLLFSSCKKKEHKMNMNNVFFDNYVMNDVETLESELTKEYDINELKEFFKNTNSNDGEFFKKSTSMLFSEVNRSYPVEILRTGGYSVYRVSQGGYFYVFWIQPFVTDSNNSKNEPSVYFSTYLSSDKDVKLFDSLTPGVSTAEDVKLIDPYFELSFLSSNGIYSYSYINDKTMIGIKYEYADNINGYDDLIVKEKMIFSRESVPSRLSVVLSSDLP